MKKRITEKLQSSPVLYRLASGTFWSLAGTIATKGFSLLTTIVIARILGKVDFGAYGIVQSTLGMFGLFAGFAMGSTLTKYVAELKLTDPARTGRILSLTAMLSLCSCGLMSVIIIFMAGWLATTTLHRADLAPVIVMGAALLFVSTQNNVQAGALAGFESFKMIAKINFVQAMATPICAIPLVYYFGLQGAVIALTVVSAVGYWLCTIALKRECQRHGIHLAKFDVGSWSEWPILWRFSFPALLAGLLVIPVTWATNTILVNQHNGYAEMGLFNAANQWRQLIVLIPQVLASVMLPVFSEAFGRDDERDFRQAFLINLRLTWAAALPITIIVIVFREPLAQLYGAQYGGTAQIISVLMAATFFNIVNGVVGTALTGAGRMWTGTAFNLAWAVVLVVATLILAPTRGGVGLAYAYLFAYLAHTVWQMAYVDFKLVRSSIRSSIGLIAATAGSLLPVCLLDEQSVAQDAFFVAVASWPLFAITYKNLYGRT